MLRQFPFAIIDLPRFLKWQGMKMALAKVGQRDDYSPIWWLPRNQTFAVLMPDGTIVETNNWIAAAHAAEEAYQFVSVLPEVTAYCETVKPKVPFEYPPSELTSQLPKCWH